MSNVQDLISRTQHDCGPAQITELEQLPFSVNVNGKSYDVQISICQCGKCSAYILLEHDEHQPYTGNHHSFENSKTIQAMKAMYAQSPSRSGGDQKQ